MEPSSGSAAAGLTITVGTVSVVGTLLGMHYDALLFGLFGGLVFLSRGAAVARSQAVAGAISSALLAGVFAPLLASMLISWNSALSSVDSDTMRCASSMIIGGGWQVALPAAFDALKRRLANTSTKDNQP